VVSSTIRARFGRWLSAAAGPSSVEVAGLAEMKAPAESEWKGLSAPFSLKRGSLVRTGKDASVDLCLNRQWDSFLRLNENSEMEFPGGNANGVRLRKGSLFTLLEGEFSVDSLSVFSADSTIRLSSGGLSVAASESGPVLRVFSESAHVSGEAKAVGEGWEWAAGRLRRMDFEDYSGWQQWVRKSYDRKDKYFLKRSL
jgi:hypothetical protein